MNLLELKINQTIKINSKWELQKGVEKSGRKVTIIFTGRFIKNHYSERFGGCTERNNINLKNVNECHQLKSKPTALLIIPRFFVGVPASGPVG